MSAQPFDRPAAKSLEEVDLHVRYGQATMQEIKVSLDKVLAVLPHMATTEYIDKVFAQLANEYAKKAEVEGLRAEVADLKVKVTTGSVSSTFDRWAAVASKLAAICAFAGAAAVAIAHLVEKLK